jgi:hypothetical protein
MKIAFHNNQLCTRGTTVAIYDYAYYNNKILNNESIILTKKKWIYSHNDDVIKKFKKHFNVFFYDNWEEAEYILKKENVDILYAMKSGWKDEVISNNIKTVIHSVFQYFQPHGNVYAYISEWLTLKMTNGKYPFVPYMINLPNINDDLRDFLNIPKNAIVFGRHGGEDSFNIPFVFDLINEIIEKRNDIYFLFLNTINSCGKLSFQNGKLLPPKKLLNHKRIIFLPPIIDLIEKTKFINTCDAMLHARTNGESFGLAIGEFSIRNKPIITWTGITDKTHDKAHFDILKDNAYYYNNKEELYDIIMNFKIENKNWDMYSKKYNPEIVMEQFKKIFID